MKLHQTLLATLTMTLVPTLLHAEEGGAGRYVPGNAATLIDIPPSKPGWILETMYLNYQGSADAARSFPNAGLVTAGPILGSWSIGIAILDGGTALLR